MLAADRANCFPKWQVKPFCEQPATVTVACAETEADSQSESASDTKTEVAPGECCPPPKPNPGREALEMLAADPCNSAPCWQITPRANVATPVAIGCAETDAAGSCESDSELDSEAETEQPSDDGSSLNLGQGHSQPGAEGKANEEGIFKKTYRLLKDKY